MSVAHDAWRTMSGKQRKRITDLIYQRDGMVCSICHLHVRREDASVDHVVPLSKGGPSTMDNLRLAHRRCNSSKGNRAPSGRVTFIDDGRDWFATRRA